MIIVLDPSTHVSRFRKFFSANGPDSKYLRLRGPRNKIEALYGSLYERKNFPPIFDDIKNANNIDYIHLFMIMRKEWSYLGE